MFYCDYIFIQMKKIMLPLFFYNMLFKKELGIKGMKDCKNILDYFKIQKKKDKAENGDMGSSPICIQSNNNSDFFEDVVFDSDKIHSDTYCLTKKKKFTNKALNRQVLQADSLENPFMDASKESCISLDTQDNLSNFDIKNTNLSASSSELNISIFESSIDEKRTPSKTPKNETRYSFMLDIKDANGYRPGDKEYDPSKLYIPANELERLTPFERQYWEIKKQYYDTIVFFKKGKFYELYENDAEISAKMFGLKVTDRVNMKMTGFPESSYNEWASKFLNAGFKIARVEQSENMVGKQIREKDGVKDKIIKREIKEVVTQGTIYNADHLRDGSSVYLASICEDKKCYALEPCSLVRHLSILIFDASISNLYYHTFCDDEQLSKLNTLFVQYNIKEYISKKRYNIDSLWISQDLNDIVSQHKYNFSNEREYTCYVALYNYMKLLKRENVLKNSKILLLKLGCGNMLLDCTALKNLEVFENSYDKTDSGTLFKSINFCTTLLGKRNLRKWVLSPTTDEFEINRRQLISGFFEGLNISVLSDLLIKMVDIERLLSKILCYNLATKDLYNFLRGIKLLNEFYKALSENINKRSNDASQTFNLNSIIDLYNLIIVEDFGVYSVKCNVKFAITDAIRLFLDEFEKSYTVSEHEINFGMNIEADFLILRNEKQEIENSLQAYLKEQKKVLNINEIAYKNIGKEIFQMDIHKDIRVPNDWFLVSKTKTTNRYYTDTLRGLVNKFRENEEKIFQFKGDLLNRVSEGIIKQKDLFYSIITDVSIIDCFLSFGIFSLKNRVCRPIIGEKFITKDLGSPIYKEYIKNSYHEKNKVLVITGPNMGGKSTLLRTIAYSVIMFQIGMNVCASAFYSPIYDRIFTRIGASDNLLRGESTFYIEMLETSNILRYATEKSLILMDELGRGTSAKDGECIAKSVLKSLVNKKSQLFFSTHYHNILLETEGISLGYMDYIVSEDDVVFLYTLVEGVCKNSNALYVAKMSNMPKSIINKAKEYKSILSKK